MADEQLLILKMLENGKITAEQATELLKMVKVQPERPVIAQPSGPSLDERQQRALQRNVRHQEERALREAERQARRVARAEARQAQAARKAGIASENLGRTVQKSLQLIGIPPSGHQGFVFTKDLDGRFDTAEPTIAVYNTNGQVVLGTSSDQDWHLRLRVRVRADDAGKARRLAEDLISTRLSPSSLVVESKRLFGQNTAADIELQLPIGPQPALTVSCTNGTISLDGFAGKRVELHTVNGRITGERIAVDEIIADSVNGGIALTGSSRLFSCRATNGRLQIKSIGGQPTELRLETVNGTIEVGLPEGDRIGYLVEASSTAGSVVVDLPGLVREDVNRPARRSVQARTRDLPSKAQVQSVRAKTISGKIRVYLEGGARDNV